MRVDSPRLKSCHLVLAEKIQELHYWFGLCHMFCLNQLLCLGVQGILAIPGSHVILLGLSGDVMLSALPSLE